MKIGSKIQSKIIYCYRCILIDCKANTRAYHRLTEGERNQVYALKKAGLTQCAIADQICVNKSTISREIKRNTGLRGYRPKQAHRLACARQSQIPRIRILDAIWIGIGIGIEKMIREDWSPEQIRGHLKDNDQPSVSPEWIYHYIYADKRNGGDLHSHLKNKKKRRKRYGSIERRGQIKNRVSIEKRPEIVDLRNRVGDWEADTVIGKQGHSVLVTLVERKTRFTVATKAANKTARAVTNAICDYLKPYRDRVLTLTRVSDLLCMSNLVHASPMKEHDDNDDIQSTTRRAA